MNLPSAYATLFISAGFDIGNTETIAQNSAMALSFHFQKDNPEEENILFTGEDAVWNEIVRTVSDTDDSADVVLYIAAHGNQDGIFLSDGKGGREFVSYSRLLKTLGDTDQDIKVFLESCMSGSAIEDLLKLDHEESDASITLVASCLPRERSWAYGPDDEKIGLLATALIDGTGIGKGSVLGSGTHVQHPMTASSNKRRG